MSKTIPLLALSVLLLAAGCSDDGPVCGDAVVEGREACDDGNAIDDDGCSNACVAARCGDGKVQSKVKAKDGTLFDEQCDDGNFDNTDYCPNTCKLAVCGDGYLRKDLETCDDGNTKDGDGCSATCTVATCGDGVLDKGEECDDGNLSDADDCLTTCLKARCGDGLVQATKEACDDGNADNSDACLTTCKLASCGDGYLHRGLEACDDGNTKDGDGCSAKCTLPSCGDGVLDKGEGCDDGDQDDTDACLTTCLKARCGDGKVQAGVEACDDGNLVDDDGCSAKCTLPSCGDGVLQQGELCDDGNGSNADACLATCQPARCGDGYLWRGKEQCDDGNGSNADACLASCTLASCGDGYFWAGVEQCDDGNSSNSDACLSTCLAARCGDGFVWSGTEECDDQNLDNTDGCLINCEAYDPCASFKIDSVTPPVACVANVPSSLTISGNDILTVNGKRPTVTFGGQNVAVQRLIGCVAVLGKFEQIQSCSGMEIAVPPGTGIGSYEIVVQNPVTRTCAAKATFSVGPKPSISDVKPVEICEGRPGNFTITGSGFAASSQVTFKSGGTTATPTSVTFVDSTTLVASFTALTPGTYDVTVSNGPGCSASKKAAVVVYKNPVVFFVDPEVVYNEISLVATIYLSGLNGGGVSYVGIRPDQSSAPLTQLSYTYDNNRPNRLLATLPKGLAPGYWEVVVRDAKTCEGKLPQAFSSTGTISMALSAVDPPFGWSQSRTAVNLTATSPPPTGQTPFQNGIRAYLSPASGTGVATELSATAFVSGKLVTGVVPKLQAGKYDVVAVNPDGTVGVIKSGFTVSVSRPPVIDSIAPGSIPNSQNEPVTVRGSGFASGVSLRLTCRDPAGTITTYSPVASGVTAQRLTMTVAAGITTQSVCVVRAQNPDGTHGEYSALGVTNPAENISAPALTSSMVTARRALALTRGAPTRAARFLYAIGGDGGSVSGALSSVEAAPVDRFGEVGTWRTLPTSLPGGRTMAAVQTLGRFIYLVGGNGGGGALRAGHRAEVLDPAHSPVINDLVVDVQPSGGSGVAAGIWYYRVAAVMGSADPDNPGGETLPSDPQPVKIPTKFNGQVTLTLRWTAVPGAASYRVYRTPSPNLPTGQERLLATVNAPTTSYRDAGGSTSLGAARRLGDLGVWRALPNLVRAREGLGLGLARDPAPANSDRYYLYATLGRGSGSTLHSTYERLPITVAADGGQSVGSWTEDTQNTVTRGRWQTAAFSADEVATVRYPANTSYIYFGPGANASANATIADVEAGRVQSGGALATLTSVSGAKPGFAGYGAAAAANQLFVFGGQGAAPSTRSNSAQICGSGGKCTSAPPALANWNSTGVSLQVPRYLLGSTVESAHIYLAGGTNGTGALRSVESTVW